MVEIVQKEDPVLRGRAAEVPIEEIPTAKIQKIIKDMKVALASQDDGVAIAAPQIGVPLRIFVMSGKVFDLLRPDEDPDVVHEDVVFINPEILKISKERQKMEEGCLSVRWLYGRVSRAKKATVKAYDEKGQAFTRGGSNLVAQIFQHEMDHLDGILFVDKADDVEELPPEEIERLKKS